MTQRGHQGSFYRRRNRWQDKRLRQLKKLANMRSAKARKRLLNPPEREPVLVPWFPLEWALRDKLSGETVWLDLKSLRDVQRRLAVVLREYVPGNPKH